MHCVVGPIAYCFSEEAKDISVCDRQWFVDHGTSARYYKDDSMESKECECTLEGFDIFDVSTTMIPDTTVDEEGEGDNDDDDDDDGEASTSDEGTESISTTASWSTVSSTSASVPSTDVNAMEESKANGYGMSVGIMCSGLVLLQMAL